MQHVLAIESSTTRLSLALQSSGCIYTFDGEGGATASATMLGHIADLLMQANIAVADLDAVAFGQGPGAFTGLRAACAVAQGLAVSARVGGIVVLPVNTLMACAQAARTDLGPTQPMHISACMDARMSEVYTASYEFTQADGSAVLPVQVLAPMLARPDQLLRVQVQPHCFTGNALAVYGQDLGEAASHVAWHAALPTASAMLTLVPALLASGAAVPAAMARPLYVRDKVAQTTAERMAAKALLASTP